MAYQNKKVMILFSLYLGLASISLYRFIYNLAEVYYVEKSNMYDIVGTIILFPIVIFSLFVAAYGLTKNKGDPRYLGFGASLSLIIFYISDFNIDVGFYGWDLRILMTTIYVIFFSIMTLFVTILFWKKINEKEIISPFFQNKATQYLFPCYIAIASISSLLIFTSLLEILVRGNNVEIYRYISLVLYIFATIILIISSKGLLENKTNTKFLALTGVLLSLIPLSLYLYNIIIQNLNLAYLMNRILMSVFVVIVLILTIYYWNKMSE